MPDTALVPERHPAHLVETRRDSATVWQGRFLSLHRDRVALPDGCEAERVYVHHPGAVMIVPILADGRLVVERQYRYPVQRAMIEFPAGKLDDSESSFGCAERELREETGYLADEWARAGLLHPAIGYSDELIEIWFARGLRMGERRLDEGEFLDVLAVSPADLLEAVPRGEVTDGKTLAALLWWQNADAGHWPLAWRPAEAWRAAASVAGSAP
ncbi:MAG: NUDIX domain-containing protein [Tepidimonas sp.]|uniref:NUDIX domain-containing protein n=1 Tax=Tepidimonas sp. TaxID=2002775 RepID=UPI004054BF02